MANPTTCSQVTAWLPLIILSAIIIVIPYLVSGEWLLPLIIWGSIVLLFCLLFWYMGKMFNYGWFTAYVKSTRRLDNQWAIVTGANSGSGYEVAKELVRRGCNVLITCRNIKKAETTIQNIEKELYNNNGGGSGNKESLGGGVIKGKLDYVTMDLGSKESVDNAINEINNKNISISILINNAGAVLRETRLSENNMELMWQANYLSPFYLTEALLPNIKKTSQSLKFGRIVNVASLAHQRATTEMFDAFFSDKRGDIDYWKSLSSTDVYGATKCAQMMYTIKLQNLLNKEKDEQGVSIGSYLYVTSLHPGYINSGFYRPEEFPFIVRALWMLITPCQSNFAMITPYKGAQTTLHCAISDDNIEPGGYHAHCEPQQMSEKAKPVIDELSDKLYNVSRDLWGSPV